VNTAEVLILLALGMVPGYWIGRARAEYGAMFHEFGRTRKRRTAYRDK
jgi:hypothetical protein